MGGVVLIGIGKRAELPADVVAWLLDCHTKIRFFTGMAGKIAVSAGAPPDQIADAAARVHRYFSQALPLHIADEEELILPALRGKDEALDQALDQMAREHQSHEPDLLGLTELSAKLASDPALLCELGHALGEHAAALEAAWAEHLRAEEELIFPDVRARLDDMEKTRILEAMRRRRRLTRREE